MEKLIWRERYPGAEETGTGHHGDYLLHLQEDGRWHAHRLSALNRTGEVEADQVALPVLNIGSFDSPEQAKVYIEENRAEIESEQLRAVYFSGEEGREVTPESPVRESRLRTGLEGAEGSGSAPSPALEGRGMATTPIEGLEDVEECILRIADALKELEDLEALTALSSAGGSTDAEGQLADESRGTGRNGEEALAILDREVGETPGEAGPAPPAEEAEWPSFIPGYFVMGKVITRTKGGVGRLEEHLPGAVDVSGLRATFNRSWCHDHAGRIITALADLGLRGELSDCEVWMRSCQPHDVRVVVSMATGKLSLTIIDEQQKRTLVRMTLLSLEPPGL